MSKSSQRFSLVAAIVASLLLSACGGGGGDSTGDTNASSTDTMAPTATLPINSAVYPLTGLPRPEMDISVLTRPALVAKIDNHPLARPQTGLNKADIVFEENVEGITRFAAVFHSQGSDPVGPLRSGRTQDVDILSAYNKPLFVWSGGNGGVTQVINKSDLVNVGYLTSIGQGKYFRDKTYRAPHNLYSRTTDIWKLAPKLLLHLRSNLCIAPQVMQHQQHRCQQLASKSRWTASRCIGSGIQPVARICATAKIRSVF